MIDHLSLAVRNLGRSRAFYAGALAPLGAGVEMEYEGGCGIGPPGKPGFWLREGEPTSALHFAFVAPDRAAVDSFHHAALAAGGADNGPPGVRAQYHPDYYAAFVLDPDGHNVEAVCHAPAAQAGRSRKGARTSAKAAGRKAKATGRGTTRSARKPSKKTRKAARR